MCNSFRYLEQGVDVKSRRDILVEWMQLCHVVNQMLMLAGIIVNVYFLAILTEMLKCLSSSTDDILVAVIKAG